jgi:hypothetical protein
MSMSHYEIPQYDLQRFGCESKYFLTLLNLQLWSLVLENFILHGYSHRRISNDGFQQTKNSVYEDGLLNDALGKWEL